MDTHATQAASVARQVAALATDGGGTFAEWKAEQERLAALDAVESCADWAGFALDFPEEV